MKNIVKIVLVVLALFPVIVNAEITLTDDVLEQGIKSLMESLKNNSEEQDSGDIIITLDRTNKQLIITVNDETLKSYYKINDDNTITFITSGRFYKGMTYEEYKNADIGLSLGMIEYGIISQINKIELEDSMIYYGFSILQFVLGSSTGTGTSKPSFIVVPDDQETTTDEGVQVIKESEFGQYSLDLAKKQYADSFNKQVLKDDQEGMINSYSYGYSNDLSKIPGLTQKEDEFYIIGELTINPNADFSKLIGFADKISDTPDIDVPNKEPSDTKDDKEADSKDTSISDSTTEQTKSTGNEETNPKTGIKDNYLVLGTSLIVGVIMLAITRKKQIFKKI